MIIIFNNICIFILGKKHVKLNLKNYLLSKQGIFLPDISEG